MHNHVELTGIVHSSPLYQQSPSGISHQQFYMLHQSEQQEAGLKRLVRCRIKVIISGQMQTAHQIVKGCKIKVIGFLNDHFARTGESQLVLHALHIEFIE